MALQIKHSQNVASIVAKEYPIVTHQSAGITSQHFGERVPKIIPQTLIQEAGNEIYVDDMGVGGPNNSSFKNTAAGDEYPSKIDAALAGLTFAT
jgi:hypothetical protein